jgi:signal transduction histidine kinase
MTAQQPPLAGEKTVELSVLVVDDQPGKLLTYRAILEGIEAHVDFVGSARDALELLLRREFAVVVVDVCMPELDGFELAAMIREHPRCERTAVIFVSGVHLTEFDRLKGYQVGAVDYLPVPIVPEILRAKVNVFLELHRKTRELELLNRDLEARVVERTAELERAARQKDEFLAVLAHELRNPLAPIRSAAHLLTLPNAPAGIAGKAAEVINRQVNHLVRLTDDLVDISRITRGMVEITRAPIDIADVVTHAVEAGRPFVDSRRHVLVVDVPAEPLVVEGDFTRLTQVLTNIVNNAAKFTEPGGHIAVSARGRGHEAVVVVSDTGAGLTAEMIPHVFDLFAQGQPVLERTSSGLGIGLALVRRIVELHGGQVTIESEGLGRGATVSVVLPIAPLAGALAVTPGEGQREGVEQADAPRRVLVVDDNTDAADALAALLRLSGHDVLTAGDGVEALRVGEAMEPDVVLLDLAMPRLNGVETAGSIRELPWGRHVGLVALTGCGQPRDYEMTTSAGFDAHLVKPVTHDDLVRTLEKVTMLQASRRPSPGAGQPGEPGAHRTQETRTPPRTGE